LCTYLSEFAEKKTAMGLPAYVDGFQAIVADVCVLQDVDFCMLQLTSKLKDTYKDYRYWQFGCKINHINAAD